MVDGIIGVWEVEGLPVNEPESVARILVEVGVGRVEGEGGDGGDGGDGEGRYNGRAVFCEGGRGWDFEAGLERSRGLWLGRENSEVLDRGQAVLGDGTGWSKD